MEMKRVSVFFLILLTGFISAAGDRTADYKRANPEGNSLNAETWSRLRDNYRYKYPEPEKKEKKEIEKNSKNAPRFFFGNIKWLDGLWYALIFLLGALILYLIVRYGLGYNESLKASKKILGFEEDPEDIQTLDIDPLLKEALGQKNFRLAIRLRFLEMLQFLNRKKVITWKRYRTNREYLGELANSPVAPEFGQMCSLYEMAWYGNEPVPESGYYVFTRKYEGLKSKLKLEVHV